MTGLIGTKQDMTQVFGDNGRIMPVTVVDIANNVIVGAKSQEKDGYNALIIGKSQKKNPSKSEVGNYKELGFVPEYTVEIRDAEMKGEQGKEVELEDLTNKKLTVVAITKGKGFQGGVKRWGFKGGPKTHGQSDRQRAPGSIGNRTIPGRVYKGKKMAGRMGGDRVTIKHVLIVKHMPTESLLLVKGAIPGPKGNKLILKLED